MSNTQPILVTGATGSMGSVGRHVIKLLRERNLPVRTFVHRLDERSDVLKEMGAEIVVGDLTSGKDIFRALQGCRRMYFGMSVSAPYLQATVTAAAAAKEIPSFEIFVNISQMTVSQMSLTEMTDSAQQQQHWLSEQVLNWSGIPVTHIRSTVFLEHFFFTALAAKSINQNDTIRLPFNSAKTSPISSEDVAKVIAKILENPQTHEGKVYELTGPKSLNMNEIAQEYASALSKPVKYVDIPFDKWLQEELQPLQLPEHVFNHVVVMAKLHQENRYNRASTDFEKIMGFPAMSIAEYVKTHQQLFSGKN